MKKRLFCLLFALVLLSLCLTSCADDSGIVEDDSEREEIWLTLYAITEESTTPEGIARTQEALNELLVDRYKTHLDLRFYTEGEYQAALDAKYLEFEKQAEEEAAAQKAAQEAARAEAEAEKKMTAEELLKKQEEKRRAEAEAAAAAAREEEERLRRIAAGEESAVVPLSDPQMDIIYINGEQNYYDYIDADRLIALDSYLKLDYKIIYDYLHPNLINSAKVSGGDADAATYGIPNNVLMEETGWYYVFDTDLAAKHGFDLTVNPPQMSVFANYISAVAASEPGVIPIANYGPVSGLDFYDEMEGFPIAAVNSEYGPFEARGVTQTYSENTTVVQSHFRYMADFRAAGYFADRPMTTADNFFMDIRQGTVADKAKWEAEGYTVLTYRRPTVSAEKTLSGLYGISSFSKQPARAMEILSALTTNETLHNLLAYGVAGTNYIVDEGANHVTMLRDDYNMDFSKMGNTLLGYLPEHYPADYKETLKESNQASKLSGFSCFYLSPSEGDLAWYDQIMGYREECEALYQSLCAGRADWAAQCAAMQARLHFVDLEGFIAEVFAPGFRNSSKEVRSADKLNYSSVPAYYLDQLPAATVPGEPADEGESVPDGGAQTEAANE